MNSPQLQMEIKKLINLVAKKQREVEQAKRRDAILEERLKLHQEIKELNNRIKTFLEKSHVVRPLKNLTGNGPHSSGKYGYHYLF